MAKRKSGRDIHGILLLDKRPGVSSNKALQEVRRLFNANKAGHTGSLDPLATGLLPLCFGEATKVSGLMLDDDKAYQVSIQLGVITDSGDAEGRVIDEKPVPELCEQQIKACLQKFRGEIEQVPPMYSALKYQGKKLYELAREGITVERKPRKVSIYDLKLLSFEHSLLKLDVMCSKGTYIRSLAEDIGQALGCGGSVSTLCRTVCGQFRIDQAYSFPQLQAMDEQELLECLVAVDKPLETMPTVYVSREQAGWIRQGQAIIIDESIQGMVRMYCEHVFLGLGEMLLNGKLAPKKLFNLNES